MMTNLSEDTHLIGGSPTIRATFQTINTPSQTDAASNNYDDEKSKATLYSTANAKETLSLHPSNKSTTYLWLLTSFSAIGGFLFGYDTGVISGAMLFLKDEFSLSSVWQEIVISVTIGSAFISALLGGFLNDIFGRKVVTVTASFMFTVGAVILGCAQNVAMLVTGRVIVGLGIGLASMTVPIYIAESAPTNMRGRLVTINNFFITAGQFGAGLMDGGFSYIKSGGWRYMLGLAGVPSVIQFCGFFFLPESPRWLMMKGRDKEAKDVLIKLRGVQTVDTELNEIKEAMDAELSNKGYNFIQVFKTPSVRRAVIVGCGLQLFQQLIGINTVMYYSATIISMSGVGNKNTVVWLAALTSGVNFIFSLIGVFLVERIGRKKLIMGSLVGVIASLLVLGIAFKLIALNSPAVTEFDDSFVNFTCSTYRNCEKCIEDTSCGFCYTGSLGSMNGSCLTSQAVDNDDHAEYGNCQNVSLPQGVMWSYGYCPTSYSWMAILGLLLYLMFFAPGMGPMPWTINSEIYPLWARATGNSLSAATNWIANLLVSMTFLTLTETITKYGTYWLFGGIAIIGLLFVGFFLPETKGRKLEEIDDLFSQPLFTIYSSKRTHTKYRPLESETSS